MARQIDEQYHALSTALATWHSAGKYFTAEADAMMTAAEAELAAMTPEPAESPWPVAAGTLMATTASPIESTTPTTVRL